MNRQPEKKTVGKMAVSCFELADSTSSQLDLFETDNWKRRSVSDAMDRMNDRYGEYVITPALLMGMKETIIDRVAFGGVKDLEEIYQL